MVLARTAVAAIALGAMAMLSPKAAPGLAPSMPEFEDAGAGADASVQLQIQVAPEVVERLRRTVADTGAADDERCRAALELARQIGPEAVADLGPLLQDARESLRIGAARGLGQAGGDDAKKALEDRLEQEETPVVREAIQRTLTLMLP